MGRMSSLYPWVLNYLPDIRLHRIRSEENGQREKVSNPTEEKVFSAEGIDCAMRSQLMTLLHGASLPLDTVTHAFAYGSGAIPQRGEDPNTKMVDFLIVCNDSLRFHQQNLLQNPSHYCLPFRWSDASWVNQLQRLSGARLYYNTRIATQGRLIKYGVIQEEDLETDLLDWTWLYASGRLQKPVLEVFGGRGGTSAALRTGRNIERALLDNYRAATHAALLQLDGSFTMDQFLNRVVSISYGGDVRRFVGAEDPQKEEKLVAGASRQLRALYKPILATDREVHIHSDDKIEQDCSTPIVFFRLTQMPRAVLERLSKAYYPQRKAADTEELLYPIAHRHDLNQHFSSVLQSIVYDASLRQSAKNFLTAGITKSLQYIGPKLRKGLLRRRF